MDGTSLIFKIIGFVILLVIISDIMGWAANGTYAGTASGVVQTLATSVIDLPSRIVCFVLDLVAKMIGFVITFVFGIVLPGTALDTSALSFNCNP